MTADYLGFSSVTLPTNYSNAVNLCRVGAAAHTGTTTQLPISDVSFSYETLVISGGSWTGEGGGELKGERMGDTTGKNVKLLQGDSENDGMLC